LAACREIRNVWEPLIPSEIPPLMEANFPVLRIEGLPERTVRKDMSFRVVFDRVLSALPTLKVKGGKGAVLTIKAHHTASFTLGDGEQFIEFPFMTEIARPIRWNSAMSQLPSRSRTPARCSPRNRSITAAPSNAATRN